VQVGFIAIVTDGFFNHILEFSPATLIHFNVLTGKKYPYKFGIRATKTEGNRIRLTPFYIQNQLHHYHGCCQE
jgi:hypothetical protein